MIRLCGHPFWKEQSWRFRSSRTLSPKKNDLIGIFYFEELSRLIDSQIKFIRKIAVYNQNIFENRHPPPVSKLKWTAGIFEFVELSKALHYTSCFNNGDIDFNTFFKNLSKLFYFSVSHPDQYYNKMQDRVGDRTLFLSKLKVNLERDMDKKDSK